MKIPAIFASCALGQSVTEPRANAAGKSVPTAESQEPARLTDRRQRNMLTPYTVWSLQEMFNLPIGKLLTAHSNLSGLNQAILDENAQLLLTEDSYRDVKQHTQNLLDACTDIGMPVTRAAVSEFAEELSRAEQIGVNFGFRRDSFLRIKARLHASLTCIGYESALKTALLLPTRMAEYYDPSSPVFGTEVELQFPSASYEIEEAAKCLAVGRGTAAVFHLMRVMEVGIYAVARCLQIPDPIKGSDKNWGQMLRKIQESSASRNAMSPKKWVHQDDDAYFHATHAVLNAVRNAWRNTTMHVENKYTVDEAEQILITVRSFMMRLASRMDEGGLPTA